MSIKDKFGKIKIKAKPMALIALSVLGSIASKVLTDKFEKQTNIQDVNINIYNYIINSLSESGILNFIDKFEKKEHFVESTETDNLDIAYDFILNNIKINVSDYIDVSFQKLEDSIVINYVFNKEYSAYLYQEGVSISQLFALANTIGEISLQLLDCLQENLGFVVPIEMKVYTNNGGLLIHIKDGKLKELNGIRPALTTQEL